MIETTMPDHLFVYGTLRAESAHPMAHRLKVGARHIGKGSTPGLLYDFGSWPGAFFGPEEKYRVIGNVFALGPNPRLLADLDKYEGIAPTDLDLIEINEAFAAVGLASAKELGIDLEKVNVNGGAIALGHPVGMSGARIALHLALELQRRGGGVGAAALCGGGGQGDALIVRVPKSA